MLPEGQSSTNPMDYMSPLWSVLVVVAIIALIVFLIAKPLHKYLTDKKTEKIIKGGKFDSDNAGDKPKDKEEDKEEEQKEDKDEEKGGDEEKSS